MFFEILHYFVLVAVRNGYSAFIEDDLRLLHGFYLTHLHYEGTMYTHETR